MKVYDLEGELLAKEDYKKVMAERAKIEREGIERAEKEQMDE